VLGGTVAAGVVGAGVLVAGAGELVDGVTADTRLDAGTDECDVAATTLAAMTRVTKLVTTHESTDRVRRIASPSDNATSSDTAAFSTVPASTL